MLLGYAGAPMPGELSNLATSAISTTIWRGARVGRMAAIGGRSIPFLSTHPASHERVENMRALASALAKP